MSGRTDMWRHVVRRGQCHHHMALVRSQRSLNSHKINTRVQFRRLSDAGVGLSGAEDVSQLLQSVGFQSLNEP